jgi:hypothetical protein
MTEPYCPRPPRASSDYLSISSPDVLLRIQTGEACWERFVPAAVADATKSEGLFGYHGQI